MTIGYAVENVKVKNMVRGVTHIIDSSSSQAHEFATIRKVRHHFEISFYNFTNDSELITDDYLAEKKKKVLPEILFQKYSPLLKLEVTMKFRKKLLKHMFQDEVEGDFVAEEITLTELYEYAIEVYHRILLDNYEPPAHTDGVEIFVSGVKVF